MKNIHVYIMFIALLFMGFASQAQMQKLTSNDNYNAHRLLQNIKEIPVHGTPGSLKISGSRATVVILDKDKLPTIAHAYFRNGQMVAMTTDQWLGEKMLNDSRIRQLVSNCVDLCKFQQPKVLVLENDFLAGLLNKKFDVSSADKLPVDINRFDVIFSYLPTRNSGLYSDPEITRVREWVAKGGVFVGATTPWVFNSYGPGKQGAMLETDFVGNKLFKGTGIQFMAKYAHPPFESAFVPNPKFLNRKKISRNAIKPLQLDVKRVNIESVNRASALVKGIDAIPKNGVPSNLFVFGENAFPFLVDKNNIVLMAYASYGKGSAVAMGNGSWLSTDLMLETEAIQILIDNSINLSTKQTKKILVLNTPKLHNYVQAKYNSTHVDELPEFIDDYDVLFCAIPTRGEPYFREKQVKQIEKWVNNGGVFIGASSGWVFKSYGPGKKGAQIETDFVANKLFAPMGISFGLKYGSGSSYKVQEVSMQNEKLVGNHFQYAIGKAIERINTAYVYKDFKAANRANKEFYRMLEGVPEVKYLFNKKEQQQILEMVKNEHLFPSLSNKIDVTEARKTNLIILADKILSTGKCLDTEFIKIAEDYPGLASNANTISKVITLDMAEPRWHSTGLWVNAFETITISLSNEAIDLGLNVQIGCHKDNLVVSHKLKSWERWPNIDYKAKLNKRITKVTSPYGGLVYIDVPHNLSGIYTITIEGATEAPLFVLGETTEADWALQLQKSQSPLGEIEGNYCVITTELSSLKREGYNPTEIAQFWDTLMVVTNRLATTPMLKYKERYVIDRQPYIGYMHSGYPIVTDDNPNMKDYVLGFETKRGKILEDGSWGHFHELGHNNQNVDWTYDGAGEVTVNLFTLYAMEEMLKISPRDHDAVKRAEEGLDAYKQNPDFKKWKEDPFLALLMYIELQEAFGWGSFKKVFREYNALDKKDRPKNDKQKRDQWVLRYSKSVGYNLCEFFDSWGFPYSNSIKNELGDLPKWKL
jgi:hypothetical protein